MEASWARRIAPAAGYQSCFIGAVALLKSGSNAVVLARYSAEALPYLYLGAATLTALLAGWNARPGTRRLEPGTLAALGAMAAATSSVGLWLGWPLTPLLAYVFAEVFATTAALSLWAVLADAFDAREARRAFTVISGVGMLGAVVGGLLAQVLAASLGASSLFLGGALLLGGGAVAFRFHRHEPAPPRRSAQAVKGVWRYLLENPYARLLGLLVLGLSVLSVLTDYFFRERVGASMGEAQMASLFGALQLWTGVFGAVFQLALAEVLLRRLGILRYLAVVPAVLGGLALAAVFSPSVWATWALKLFEGAATFSLLPVGVQLLYSPLPDGLRDAARSAIDGFLRKGGLLVGGLLLAATSRLVNETALGLVVVGLAAALCGLLLRIRPAYLEVLHKRVSGVGAAVKLDLLDERSLAQVLRAEDSERVLRAVDLIIASGASIVPHLRTLLTHRHERVRERGVHLAVQHREVAMAPLLEPLVRGAARRPRDAAVWALATLAPGRAAELLPELSTSDDVGLKTAAIGALLSVDRASAPARQALGALLERAPSAPVAERREVARLLGRLRDEAFAPALAHAMDDADASVRQVAIRAVGEGGYALLAYRLLRFLTWRDERRAAREALEAIGEPVVGLVAQALDDRSRALALRYQLPRVLRQIGTQSAFEALLFSNARDDSFLHYRVGVSLSRLKDAHPALHVDRAQVLAAIARRREVYRDFLTPYGHLRAAYGHASLVTRALGDRLDQAFELCFLLLGLVNGERSMRRAHSQLRAADPRGRAWARELLDNLLAPDERALVADQLEADHRTAPMGDADLAGQQLARLCVSDDFVVRACARKVARNTGQWPTEYQEDDMSEATVRRLFALEGVDIFAESDVDDISAIAAVAKEQTFARGSLVYAEGDPGDALYVVVEGSAEARRDGELVMRHGPRDSFGEVSLFDGAPRVTDVVAVEEVKALVIDRRDFLDLIADRPELLTGVFRVLSRQLKSMVVELAARKTTSGEMPAIKLPEPSVPTAVSGPRPSPPVPHGQGGQP